jgi:hypothetical protein
LVEKLRRGNYGDVCPARQLRRGVDDPVWSSSVEEPRAEDTFWSSLASASGRSFGEARPGGAFGRRVGAWRRSSPASRCGGGAVGGGVKKERSEREVQEGGNEKEKNVGVGG